MATRDKGKYGLAHLVLSVFCLLILSPVLLLVNVALKSNVEFLNSPLSFVQELEWRNFAEAWLQAEMGLYFKNSVIITFFVSVCTCVVATMAAYPIARQHYRGSQFVHMLFMSALFLPVGLVPLVVIMDNLGFMNSYIGFILFKTGGSLAIAVFILVAFVKSLPRELDEAAAMDGCGYLRFIFTIVFPLIKPAFFTVAMLTAMNAWNDFINPLLFMTDKSMRPLTAGLYMFFGQFSTNWTILAAGIIVVAAPLMMAYVFLQKYIIAGVTSGAVKG